MFSNSDGFVKTYKFKTQRIKAVLITVENRLVMVANNFKKYRFSEKTEIVLKVSQLAAEGIFIEIERQFSNKSQFKFSSGS